MYVCVLCMLSCRSPPATPPTARSSTSERRVFACSRIITTHDRCTLVWVKPNINIRSAPPLTRARRIDWRAGLWLYGCAFSIFCRARWVYVACCELRLREPLPPIRPTDGTNQLLPTRSSARTFAEYKKKKVLSRSSFARSAQCLLWVISKVLVYLHWEEGLCNVIVSCPIIASSRIYVCDLGWLKRSFFFHHPLVTIGNWISSVILFCWKFYGSNRTSCRGS